VYEVQHVPLLGSPDSFLLHKCKHLRLRGEWLQPCEQTAAVHEGEASRANGQGDTIRVGSSGHVTVVIGVGPGPQGRPRPERRRQQRVGERDRAVQAGTGKNKIRSKGGSVDSALPLVKAVSGKMPRNRLRELADDPDVAYISPDRPLHSYLNNAAVAVNAPVAWSQGLDGSGIGVAVLDSGTQNVNDLVSSGGNSIVYKNSFIAGNTSTADGWGHGTHVSGIISGNGHSSQGLYQGIAPNANILNFRVLDDNGVGQDSYVISAIQTAIALKNIYNIRVINLSLGRPVYESYTLDPLCQAVEQAWQAGIVVVVAAGNDGRDNSAGTNGYATITAPGNDPYVLTVGAMKSMGTPTRSDDLIASYSSKGPTAIDHIVKPDLVAPGNLVVSLNGKSTTGLAQQYPQNVVSNKYFTLSGTSMATAVVSGAAADLLQAQPSLTPDQVKARLMKTAYKVFPQYIICFDLEPCFFAPRTSASAWSQSSEAWPSILPRSSYN